MILESIIDEIGNEKMFIEVALVLSLIYYVSLTVAQWKIFTKAGEKGWKSLIPIYSVFVSHHLIGMRHFWFVLDIVFWLTEVVFEVTKSVPLWAEEAFVSVAVILTIMSEIIHIMKLCYCYTKSELFGIGLFLIPPLFSLILAFDKSEYNPPKSHRKHHTHKNTSDS